MARFAPVTVQAVRPEGDGAVCVTLGAPEDWSHRAGQYLTLRRPDTGVRRSYSIAAAPGAPLSVGIRAVPGGAFSDWAQGLRPGDALEAMPPEGRFVLGEERDVLLIAAGSGVTPMVAIAGAVLAAGGRATLVYGNRGIATTMFRSALDALKDRHMGRFRLIHVMSREAQDVPLLSGRVDAEKLHALARAGLIDPMGADGVFLCGPGGMIEEASAALRALGTPEARIRFERFTPAGAPAPAAPRPVPATAGATVEVTLDGATRSFPMTGATVLDAAEAAGLDLPWSCRGGMCCTCRCKAEGAHEMTANFSLEPWEVEAGFTLACQTRPLGKTLALDFDAA